MRVPFVKDAYVGEVPINWFPAADDDNEVIMFGCPGLETKVIPNPDVEVRDMKVCGDTLYAVCGNELYSIDFNYIATSVGTIGTYTGRAWIEYNGDQVAVCDGVSMWTYTESTTTFAQVTDVDFLGAIYLTYQDSYGIFSPSDSQRFYLTAPLDFTDIPANNFASAEASPDNLVVGKSHYRELWLFGTESTEQWYNAGGTFAFQRLNPGLIEQGCGAAASVASGDNVIYWLSSHRQVLMAVGYQPTIISSRKMERELETYSILSDAVAFCWVYQGHAFYQLTFPTENVTWVYDAATKLWHKRRSWKTSGDYVVLGRHRANCYARFGNLHLMGDFKNGKIYKTASDLYDDDGENLIAELDSSEIKSGGRTFFRGIQITFDHGYALITGQGSNPQAMLSWSGDGGNTWGPELWTDMGARGEYSRRSIWRRGGSDYRRTYKLKISDPICRDILGVDWL